MDSKLIFTVENPEDLYIIGHFPWDNDLKKLISKKFGKNRYVGITDDYHSISVMGDAKKHSSNHCETEGSFLLLTKSEWEDVCETFYNNLHVSFEDLPNEEYAICIHDYVGPVKIDLIDYNGESILPEYDDKEELLYQNSRTSDEYCEPVVLLRSGFRTTAKYIQELYGFVKQIDTEHYDIYVNVDTGVEFIGNYLDLPTGNWMEIGERKIIDSKWLKQ